MGDIAIRGDGIQEHTVEQVHGQVQKIQILMKAVMREGDHYGIIPGTQKPSLYKAGAEKIAVLFRLAPEFDVKRTDLEGGHREFEVLCKLYHMGSGVMVGQGVGSCSTMESKYRWRNTVSTEEVGEPSRAFWDVWKDDRKKAHEILVEEYGPGTYKTKKIDDVWKVLRVTGDGERVENPDIADQYNTVLKMAKKRAFVDATITATAASDFFTQDVEDMPEFAGKTQPKTEDHQPGDQPAKITHADAERTLKAMKSNFTEQQIEDLRVLLSDAGEDQFKLNSLIDRAVEMAAGNAGGL